MDDKNDHNLGSPVEPMTQGENICYFLDHDDNKREEGGVGIRGGRGGEEEEEEEEKEEGEEGQEEEETGGGEGEGKEGDIQIPRWIDRPINGEW